MFTFSDLGIENALKDLYGVLYENNHPNSSTRFDDNYDITLYNDDKEIQTLYIKDIKKESELNKMYNKLPLKTGIFNVFDKNKYNKNISKITLEIDKKNFTNTNEGISPDYNRDGYNPEKLSDKYKNIYEYTPSDIEPFFSITESSTKKASFGKKRKLNTYDSDIKYLRRVK
jgi:hypothetical protein